MADWADDVAEKLCWADVGPFVSQDEVAAALRQARLDALEEAAKATEGYDWSPDSYYEGCDVIDLVVTHLRSLKEKQP